jgi:hypothetical protein
MIVTTRLYPLRFRQNVMQTLGTFKTTAQRWVICESTVTTVETLKNLNETLNKIIVDPNILANQKGKIILNVTRAIENISKS